MILSDFLKNQESITVKELQSKIRNSLTDKPSELRYSMSSEQPKDLKIISPFYKRIDQHPKNCKCIYHKRVRPEVKKIERVRTHAG